MLKSILCCTYFYVYALFLLNLNQLLNVHLVYRQTFSCLLIVWTLWSLFYPTSMTCKLYFCLFYNILVWYAWAGTFSFMCITIFTFIFCWRFDFCKDAKEKRPSENLGQVLFGERIESSPYKVSVCVYWLMWTGLFHVISYHTSLYNS